MAAFWMMTFICLVLAAPAPSIYTPEPPSKPRSSRGNARPIRPQSFYANFRTFRRAREAAAVLAAAAPVPATIPPVDTPFAAKAAASATKTTRSASPTVTIKSAPKTTVAVKSAPTTISSPNSKATNPPVKEAVKGGIIIVAGPGPQGGVSSTVSVRVATLPPTPPQTAVIPRPLPPSNTAPPATPTRLPDNVAVVQDLNGLLVAQLSVGTPPQRFRVLIDTAGSNSYVAGSNCTNCPKSRARLDASKSTSGKLVTTTVADGKQQVLDFGGQDTVVCNLLTDSVGLARLSAPGVAICAATSVTGSLAKLPADGIIGLGLSERAGEGNMITAMVAAKAIPKAVVGLDLQPENGATRSKLYLGSVDPSLLYKVASGNIIAGKRGLATTFTSVAMTGTNFSLADVSATIDTALDVNLMPMGAFRLLTAAIPGSAPFLRPTSKNPNPQPNPGRITVPCKTAGSMSMKLTSGNFNIPFSDFVGEPVSITAEGGNCRFLIVGDEQTQAMVLGLPFLELAYTVIDYDARTIGFSLKPK
ncbi:aspartic peptidase domain-containing protein [Phlyctochytrium arcticum]|nr:aspartic peptidase domain-containing protein [Phlyctochytrium arcticum]